MWPWEDEPHSIAHGILDDETYDWLAVVEGMLATGGDAARRRRGRRSSRPTQLALEATGIDVDHTGSAGLAGLLALRAPGPVADDERVAVLFTGVSPNGSTERRESTMRSFPGRDILSLKDFERAEFERVFEVCDELAPIAHSRQNADLLADKTLLTAFYQPSTRTRLATEAAMHRLGGHVLGFSDAKMTRAGDFYQESIKDTVHMLEYYGDVIAMRHFQQGAPAEAAKWASVPVINCGDGWGEHPTQVLTDLYTTQKELGTLDGLTFLLVGDMRMRTMHSILYAMSQFDVEGVRRRAAGDVAAARVQGRARRAQRALRGGSLGRGRDRRLRRDLHGAGRPARLHEVARRAGRERRHDARGVPGHAASCCATAGKPGSIVLHSLPRMDELPEDVDATRHARYWSEAFNGVVMRMALLSLVLGAME